MVAWALFLSVTGVAIWYLLVRTFGLRAENTVEVSLFKLPVGSEDAHCMVYGVPNARKRPYRKRLPQDATTWIDLRTASTRARIDIPSSHVAVVLDHFDCRLNDVNVVQQRVELLERLLHDKYRTILLFVGTDPLNFVTATYDAEKHGVLLARFALVLSRFKLAYRGRASRQPTSIVARIRNALGLASGKRVELRRAKLPRHVRWRRKAVKDECRHPDLLQIRHELLLEAVSKKWSRGQIIQQVHSRANAIYQRWWSQCTRVEKFTLIELARGNPMNPNNWDAARRLAVRGYLIVDPFYRIGSESLRQFVGRMALTEDVKSWHAASPGAWNQIKVPLLVLFIGVIVFIGVTQPGLFNATVAFVAAGAASLPFLANALSARLQRVATGDK
jgi:hypothetical protein